MTVVGVDVKEGQWRLWNWLVEHERQLHVMKPLDANIQRAYVVTDQEQSEQGASFWLIEQYADSVRISKRDAMTLVEVSPTAVLRDIHLFSQEEYGGVLTSNEPIGLLSYQNTLLVLGVKAQRQVVLYQVLGK